MRNPLQTNKPWRRVALGLCGAGALACSGWSSNIELQDSPIAQQTVDTGVDEGIAADQDKLKAWADYLRSHPGADTPAAITRDCEQAAPLLHEIVLRGPKTAQGPSIQAIADCKLAGNDTDEVLVLAFAAERRHHQVFAALQHQPDDRHGLLLDSFASWLPNLDGAQLLELIRWLDHASWADNETAVAAFAQSIQHEWPPLAAQALQRSIDRAAGIEASAEAKPRLQNAARAQLDNLDPAVRGLARVLLARLGPTEDDTIAILEGLSNKHATTRSYACQALSDLRDPALAFHLEGLFADTKPNEWTMRPYKRLTGEQVAGPQFRPSSRGRVDDAALYALAALTQDLPESERFIYRSVNLRYLDLDLQAAGRDARDWLRSRELAQ